MNWFASNRLKGQQLILWLTVAFLVICLASGLPDFPDSARVYSRVLYNKPGLSGGPQLFTVEEFLNKKDGNIMLKVKESRSKQSKFKNYYRVGVVPNKLIDTETNKSMTSVVEYDPIENQCNLKQLDEWPLSGMSNILKIMTQIDGMEQGKELAADWTAIGPMALLRLVVANSKKILSKTDDESEYFFWKDFSIPEGMKLRVVCAVPMALVDTRGKISTEITFDSIDQLHSFRLSFVICAKNYTRLQYNGPLILSNLQELENMHISYLSIVDRSVSKHQGLDAFDDDEANPFTMPSGLGCGFLTTFGMVDNLLFLDTTQFSGLYMGENSKVEQFIAFDGHSRHLRVDRIGESKIIYDLRRKRATLIADRHLNEKQVPKQQEQSEPREKCAQMVLLMQPIDSGLYEVERMADVLGFESYTGLAYLGSKTLEDGVHCLLFERELSPGETIPLIMRLNMRTEARPNDRLYLTFYFADEFFETKKMAAHKVERPQFFIDSVWLKRIELKGKSSIMTHSKLLSRVTFSQSAWNLGIADEFENDRQLRNVHPITTFDTLECKTTDLDQTKLELVIEQITPKSPQESLRQMEEIYDQSGAVGESIMMFLSRCIGIPRSQINKFELILPPAPTMQQQQQQPNAFQSSNQDKAKFKILAEATIIPHLDFNFEKYLLGWVKTYAQISYALKDDVVMLRYDEFATYNDRFECAMIVATSVTSSFNRNILMLFCPHVGCGYLRDLGSFEYIKNQENPNHPNSDNSSAISPTDYYDRCEIHRLKKIADPDVSKKYSPQNLKFELQGARFSTRSELSIDPIDKSVIDFEAKIAKVVATKGGHHHSQSLGVLLQRGTCYTSKLTKSNDIQQLQTISLSFDVHQSSPIYCHKACLLYPHCRTYSYSITSRVCVLTNLPKEQVNSYLETHYGELTSGPSCNLYALNAMQLYKDSLLLLMISLDSLQSSGQYYFAASSQEECASLCHEHEFSASEKESRCLGFKYFKVNGMCAIEDKSSRLFDEKQKQIHDMGSSSLEASPIHPPASKKEYFISLLTNHAEWEQTNSCQNYERDYSQYYEHTAWIRVNSDQPIRKPKKANKPKKVDADASEKETDLELIELKTLYDLSPQACLRECSIIVDDCVMVDYCFHPINSSPTRYCAMYRIVEGSASDQVIRTSLPSSKTTTTTTQLNEFLQSLNANDPNSQSIFKKNPSCDNYRLSEDYLTLKRQIAENSKTDSELDGLANEDSANSENYRTRLDQLIKNHLIGGGLSSGGFGFGSAFFMLVMGACLGSLVAYFMVERPKTRPTIDGPILASNDDDELKLCDASQGRDNSNATAAGSSIELNELMDLYEH